MRRAYLVVLITGLAASLHVLLHAQELRLPMAEGSVRFAILGDAGTGGSAQRRIAERLVATHQKYPFEFVLMLGDNLYGSERPRDYASKFERPYKPLLDAGVRFYAALGNHDEPEQRFYEPFNMGGERYYTFKAPRGSARFYALDSNYMEQEQLDWLRKELPASDSDWKIAFFHHPLYSSGERHGPDEQLREQVEPLFVEHGVDVVFTGHEHFYERIKPQKGIHYIISGAAAKLRRGNIGTSDLTAKGYDQAYTFMIIEIVGDQMYFQTITDKGITVDSGVIRRRTDEGAASGALVFSIVGRSFCSPNPGYIATAGRRTGQPKDHVGLEGPASTLCGAPPPGVEWAVVVPSAVPAHVAFTSVPERSTENGL